MSFVGIWEFTWKIKKSQQKTSSFLPTEKPDKLRQRCTIF